MTNEYNGLQFNIIKEKISNYCAFSLGQKIILDSEPLENRLELQRELDRLKEALQITVAYGTMPFGGVHDVIEYVSFAMKDGTLNGQELNEIAQQAYAIETIRKFFFDVKVEHNNLNELVGSLTSFNKLATEINRCISYDCEVVDKASSELSSIRKRIKSLQNTIANKISEFISQNTSILQDSFSVTKNDRSVVLVKNAYKNTVEGLHYGMSGSSSATYIEPACTIGLNNELQQAKIDEQEEIARILYGLSQQVKREGQAIISNTQTLGILDSIFAKARWAKENDGIVGEISKQDFLVEQARHPLIDAKKVVANSYHIQDPIKMVLITGPNTGGKTVSLKVIGLFSIMFLSGFPLTAKQAQIPMFDHVYYDIGDSQSIDQDLSTFSGHIAKIADIIKKATRKSLVILDELGSATDPVEGQALASAILDYFRQMNIYVVATTHYSKLKVYGKQYEDIMVSSVEFNQIELKPTYHYIENSIGQSNAIEIAKRYGLKEQIINAAFDFKLSQQSESDIVLEKLQTQLELNLQKEQEIEQLKKEILENKMAFEKEKEQFYQDKETIIEEAKAKASQIISDAKEETEEIIEELKSSQTYDLNKVAQLKHQMNEIDDYTQNDQVLEGELNIGDYVRVGNSANKGEIIEINRKNAIINSQGIRISAKLESLVKIAKPVEKVAIKKTKVTSNKSFSTEINLIGYRVEEALEEVDRYLDNAIIARVPFVRIIHGGGTGALRQAIWNRLKKKSYVEKFEFAGPGQGSTGATIVTFKS